MSRKALLGQVWSENQSCLFKMKFVTYTNSNMLDSVVKSICLALGRKIPFLRKFCNNNKIISLLPGQSEYAECQIHHIRNSLDTKS